MIKIDNVKKIGVISDTHIPTRAKKLPEKLFLLFKDADLIIHCGDIVCDDVIFELSTISKVYAVKGNMDPIEITYPENLIFNFNNKFTVAVTHGKHTPFNLKELVVKNFLSIKPYMVIFGHTHSPSIEEFLNVKVFNPGSATCGISLNTVGLLNVLNDKILCEIIPV